MKDLTVTHEVEVPDNVYANGDIKEFIAWTFNNIKPSDIVIESIQRGTMHTHDFNAEVWGECWLLDQRVRLRFLFKARDIKQK